MCLCQGLIAVTVTVTTHHHIAVVRATVLHIEAFRSFYVQPRTLVIGCHHVSITAVFQVVLFVLILVAELLVVFDPPAASPISHSQERRRPHHMPATHMRSPQLRLICLPKYYGIQFQTSPDTSQSSSTHAPTQHQDPHC